MMNWYDLARRELAFALRSLRRSPRYTGIVLATLVVVQANQIGNAEAPKLAAALFGSIIALFSIAGGILSVIGLYGVGAYGVHHRRREVGVRLALGATAEMIVRLLIKDSMRFVVFGMVAGLALGIATSCVARIVLFDVSAVDIPVYAGSCALFGALALVGSWLPARRAALVSPAGALKDE